MRVRRSEFFYKRTIGFVVLASRTGIGAPRRSANTAEPRRGVAILRQSSHDASASVDGRNDLGDQRFDLFHCRSYDVSPIEKLEVH